MLVIVNVWHDAMYVYVEYVTEGDWCLLETHVDVVGDPDDFPMTKKGNPIPGHFEYSMCFEPNEYEQDYIEMIPIGDFYWQVYIAAHAVVFNSVDDVESDCFYVISDENNYCVDYDDYDAEIASPQPPVWGTVDYDFSGNGADWIWAYEYPTDPTIDQHYWFWNQFNIPGKYIISLNGDIYITADNYFDLYVNGYPSNHVGTDVTAGWKTVEYFDISSYLELGTNYFDIYAENTGVYGAEFPSNPAGLIYESYICYEVVTDTETAWGDGIAFELDKKGKGKGDGNWGMYFEYHIGEVTLVKKDPGTWDRIQEDTYGILNYDPIGDTFRFSFKGYKLEEDTQYYLIYYADPWAGDNPGAIIARGMTNGDGYISIINRPGRELDMDLPAAPDENLNDGAKVWLVPADCYDYVTNTITSWQPTRFLFEETMADRVWYDDTDVYQMVEKDPVTWDPVPGGAYGILTYKPSNSTFDFEFNGYNLLTGEDYSLIYYADPWPGDNPGAFLGENTSDLSGGIQIIGNEELNMNLDGAKIWLVLKDDYDDGTYAMTGWNPTEYLFENELWDLVTYDDTDI